MSKSFETPRYPSAEQQVVDALLWSFFGPAFLKQFLSLEHSTGEHGEHGSKFQRFNLLGDIASHISTWLTEDISSCIKHHFTYKACIQLSAFIIFFHHHLSHKIAIIPLDWICENSSISKTLAYLYCIFVSKWLGLTNQSIPSLIPPFATDGRHGRRKNTRCFRAQQRIGSPHVPTTSREHPWPATLQCKGWFFGKDNNLQWSARVSNDLVVGFHIIRQVTTHF